MQPDGGICVLIKALSTMVVHPLGERGGGGVIRALLKWGSGAKPILELAALLQLFCLLCFSGNILLQEHGCFVKHRERC